MIAELRFEDHRRAARALIGCLDDDQVAVDTVMHDVIDDESPAATAAMLFAMLALAGEVLTAAVGSTTAAADLLRARLAALTNTALEQGDPDA